MVTMSPESKTPSPLASRVQTAEPLDATRTTPTLLVPLPFQSPTTGVSLLRPKKFDNGVAAVEGVVAVAVQRPLSDAGRGGSHDTDAFKADAVPIADDKLVRRKTEVERRVRRTVERAVAVTVHRDRRGPIVRGCPDHADLVHPERAGRRQHRW